MDEHEIISAIVEGFEGVETVTADDNTFFFYGAERMFPFATLMTNDINDSFSNLSRPSVCRLNIGVGKQTFQALFGTTPPDAQAGGSDDQDNQGAVDAAQGGYDFSALDTIMPHPVYARQRWVCVLSPSRETFERQVLPLLAEAYRLDVAKHSRGASPAKR